jgi:hypothetical protein
VRRGRSTRSRVAVRLLPLLTLPWLALAIPVAAAPTPEPEIVGRAWLDAALPTDAPAGSSIHVGVFAINGDPSGSAGVTIQLRLHSKLARVKPSVVTATPDWPGHYVADIVVPTGGVGTLDVVIPAEPCATAGCDSAELVFQPVSPGPPLGLPLPFLSTATLTVSTSSPGAGDSMTAIVMVMPRVDWPAPGLEMPDALTIQVRDSKDTFVKDVPAPAVAGDPGQFQATFSIDDGGTYVVQAADAEKATDVDLFAGAQATLTVVAAPSASPAPVVTATEGGIPDWWPVGLVVAALAVAAALIVRGRPRA